MKTNPYAVMGTNPLRGILGVVTWRQTYLNIVYLVLGFPLGLAYFIFYVVGGSLGVGLFILMIGAVLLLLLILAAQWLGAFERLLAVHVLDVPIVPGHTAWRDGESLGRYLKAVLRNRTTWTGLLYLLAKFPLGLASWLVVVVAGSVTLALIGAPLVDAFGGDINLWTWHPETWGEFLLLSLIGLALLPLVLHLFNGLAWLWGRFTRLMLGGPRPVDLTRASEVPAPLNILPTPLPFA
ncbi:MAG: sensor domain-containing protein [Vicinamibacteria bacterium]